MGLPVLLKKIFESDGYGPKLNRSVIPFAASPASASPSDVASAGWVKDLVDAEVYVDASVSSSGDGLTASTAVKTIAEGIELLKQYPSGSGLKTRLHIAGGTYNETVEIQNIKCSIYLSGNVTINGLLRFNYFTGDVGTDSSTTLTVGSLDIEHKSYVRFKCKVVVSNNSSDGVGISHHSYCQFDADISVTVNSYNGFVVSNHSSLYFYGNVSVSAKIGFFCSYSSMLIVSSVSCLVNASDICCYLESGSLGRITSPTISFTTSGTAVVYVSYNSQLLFYNFTNFTVTNSANGITFYTVQKSLLNISVASNATLTISRNVTGDCFSTIGNSKVRVQGKGTVAFSGKSTITVQCSGGSWFEFANALTVSGSFSAGKRYDIGTLSLIDSGSAGTNRFPGTTAGTVSSNSAYYL